MTDKLGECPVSTAMNFDGTNEGVAGGRACWMVLKNHNRMASSGLCTGASCQNCEFYRRVQHEEKHSADRRIEAPVAS